MQGYNQGFPPQGGPNQAGPGGYMNQPGPNAPVQQTPPSSNVQVFSLTTDSTGHDPQNILPRETAPNINIDPDFPIRNYEVSSEYVYRKQVYENVMKHLNDRNKAICYSNIWHNMTYLGNRYSKNVEDTVRKYAPDNYEPPKLIDYYSASKDNDNSYQGYDQQNYQRR